MPRHHVARHSLSEEVDELAGGQGDALTTDDHDLDVLVAECVNLG